MMQPNGGMAQQPSQQQTQQPQQWGMMPPQYHHQPPMPMWNQQPSQVPPPQVPIPMQQQPQYPPQQQYHSAAVVAGSTQQPTSSDEIRTLWIGDLPNWVEENYLNTCFAPAGELISVKVIRNKQTMQSEGYGFIEFASRATAERVLLSYNGQPIPNTEQKFRLNWATLGAGEKRDDSSDFPIFVGDLAADVTDYLLEETFKTHYSSVKGAKVVIDRTTGRSKGYGFVKFADATEQSRAMTEMNGMFCSTRPMRIGPAATKKSMGALQQYPAKPYTQSNQTSSESDPNNTTIFVGGLDSSVTDDVLKRVFSQYGELVHVKIPLGKRCGFVQFAMRSCAEDALNNLNGTLLGTQSIRLSWGRSSNKQGTYPGQYQPQQDPNQAGNNSYYGYPQGYENYGYSAAPPQDHNMYAYGGYPPYGNYQQQQ
ncbi:RNA-binding (RRM/RBD/RNP motifs) family protein [Zostera marina]|uniref:RNA-binding (RRM/RBD/RNP motifs) family protein n=1 Tax=Zostera marina TaxID=29655 RepID=A0A0K9PNI6_ZOSMR|nr:RNA-binding (RRM/RBD/RNP motifs) family protein [Zostera marina]